MEGIPLIGLLGKIEEGKFSVPRRSTALFIRIHFQSKLHFYKADRRFHSPFSCGHARKFRNLVRGSFHFFHTHMRTAGLLGD